MSDSEKLHQDQEPTDIEKNITEPILKPRRAFSKVRRELNEEELSSPAAQRLLLDQLEQAEQRIVELSGFEDRFHKVDKEKGILEERMRKSIASEIIFGVCLTIGATLIGLAPYLWAVKPYAHFSLWIGVVLIIGGIISRAVRK